MRKVFILITIGLLTGSYSCQDLEEEIYSEFASNNYFQDENHLRSAAFSQYDFFSHSWMEDLWFHIVTPPSKYFVTREQAITAPKTVYQEANSAIMYTEPWIGFYRIISRSNTIIKYAGNADVSEDIINQYIAEAKFFRAFCYFHIVRIWGKAPYYDGPVEDLNEDLIYKARDEVDFILLKDRIPYPFEVKYHLSSSEIPNGLKKFIDNSSTRIWAIWTEFKLK